MIRNDDNRISLYIGLNTYLICGSILVAYAALEILRITSLISVFALGMLLATVLKAVIYRMESPRPSTRTILLSEFSFVAGAVVLALVSAHFFDYSWDGRYYHQEGVIQLCQGYNPFYQQLDETMVNGGLWINHYPKASEIVSASLYAVSGNIELGKVQNLLFLFSNLMVGYWLVVSYLKFSRIKSLIFSLLMAANPVVLTQVLTYYVDGQMYSLMLATTFLLVLLLVDRAWSWYLVLAPLIFYSASIKFTAAVYLAMMLLAFCAAPLIIKPARHVARNLIMSGLLFVIAIVVIGYNPYVSNTIVNGHPLYPVYGMNNVDIITDQSPAEFSGLNRFSKAFRSYFGETDNILASSGDRIRFKLPLTFSREEIKRLDDFDLRVAGFGPLFSGFALIAGALYGLFAFMYFASGGVAPGTKFRLRDYPLEVLAGCFLLSALLMPEFWWARYAPQIWLIPILLLMAISKRIGLIASLARIPLAIALLNIAMFFAVVARSNVLRTNADRENLEKVQASHTPIQVYFDHRDADRIKFATYGIPYTETRDRSLLTGKYQNRLFRSAIIAHDNQELADLLAKP
ncbi:MAG: hypothetical protein WAU88_00840 [Candidatus Zixiibacteriota bacterium]